MLRGGFGSTITTWLNEHDFDGKIKRLGVPDQFITHGKRELLLKDVGLDVNSIVKSVKELYK